MTKLFNTVAISLATAFSLTGAALAADDLRVDVRDLNLASPADAAVAKARVKSAVAQFCRSDDNGYAPGVWNGLECRRSAGQAARQDLARAERQAIKVATLVVASR